MSIMDLGKVDELNLIIQFLGTIGAIMSVLWAIHVYRKENDNKNLIGVKNSILRIPSICREIDMLLSEPFFAALGNSVADELKKLCEEGQSLEDFSRFLLDDERSHNYKAQAIYSGLKKCDEVTQIKDMLKSVQDAERSIELHFPGIGLAVRKLTFYIDRAATKTVSSRILNLSLSAVLESGAENEGFKRAVADAAATGSRELYFKEIAVFITNVSRSSLKQGVLGQRTIDLSLTMVKNTCAVFGELSVNRLKHLAKRDARIFKKVQSKNEKHAVEDAMIVIKKYKKLFKEDKWDKMIECKGRIIENMERNSDS